MVGKENEQDSKYAKSPREEVCAQESFRRSIFDKAFESSALSWPEHIHNHDLIYSQNSSRRGSIFESIVLSDHRTTTSSFHSVTASSTLRKRRSRTYSLKREQKGLENSSPSPEPQPVTGISLANRTSEDDIEVLEKNEESLQTSVLPEGRKRASRREDRWPCFRWEAYYGRHAQLLVSLAVFSYLGEISRFFIELGFGKACHMSKDLQWRICTSDPGTTDSTGGAFFTDLPTNVIGCFVMGLLVSGDGESIAVNIPMAAIPRASFFQKWIVSHVGIRTGFCGALTTFASWNTQMVAMVCGGRGTKLGYSQWMSAIWGYVVGLYGSIQSYQFGVAIAFCLSRWHNPELAKEADSIIDKQAIGVLINRDLPDFERRFLHSIVIHEDFAEAEKDANGQSHEHKNLMQYGKKSGYESFYDNHVHHLKAWKETTDNYRNRNLGSGNQSYVEELQEKNLLVDKIEPRQELLDIARDAGWDFTALQNWTSALTKEEMKNILSRDSDDAPIEEDRDVEQEIERAYFGSSSVSAIEIIVNLGSFLILTSVLIWGFVRAGDSNEDNSELWRSQCLAALLAPLGTYSRWYLSRLNGSIEHPNWEWLPIGTFLANMLASMLSALMSAILLNLDPDINGSITTFLKAIQTGYAGSFSTVSTFATETVGLLRALPRAFWGYYYSFGSLICACVLGIASYAWAVV